MEWCVLSSLGIAPTFIDMFMFRLPRPGGQSVNCFVCGGQHRPDRLYKSCIVTFFPPFPVRTIMHICQRNFRCWHKHEHSRHKYLCSLSSMLVFCQAIRQICLSSYAKQSAIFGRGGSAHNGIPQRIATKAHPCYTNSPAVREQPRGANHEYYHLR